MKSKKSIQASLRILLLLEEFTGNDLKEAVKMLEGDFDNENPLILFLQSRLYKQNRRKTIPKPKPKETKCSRVILELEKKDKEKYLLLSKVDGLIREGKVLRKLTDIKTIANQISKEFPDLKSRKGAIPKFMTLLANMTTSEAAKIVESIIQSQYSNVSESEYHELASFLIGNEKQITEQLHSVDP